MLLTSQRSSRGSGVTTSGVLLPDVPAHSATNAEMTALRILENLNGVAEIEARESTIPRRAELHCPAKDTGARPHA